MKLFTRNKIIEHYEEAAEKLKRARREKKLSLDHVSKKINISSKYLEAIEKNQLHKLPAGLYGKNFISAYASFLGLNSKEIVELFGLSNGENKNSTSELFKQKVPGAQYFLSLPKILTASLMILLFFVCVGYLGLCLKNIISPPNLSITNPMTDLTLDKNSIDIQGLTEPEAEVMINGELVLTNPAGFFIKTVNLKSGLNTISISAQKKYSRKNLVEKKILVKS